MPERLEPRAAVRRMKEYHPPLGQREGLRLDFNENTATCSPRVLEVLSRVSALELAKYPQREPVEALVAERLGVLPEQVLLTNGVDEAIHVLCQAFVDESDEVLLPVPTYSMYEVYASSAGAKVVAVQAGADFEFPLERVLQAVSPRTRLIAIANPNSPTGRVVSREAIVRVLEAAPQAAVIVDEAYFHFYGETALDLLDRMPNLFVARTFSKAYGLAGLRLGAILAQEAPMRWLRRVISPYSVNALALACLPAALDDSEYLDWYVGEVKAARAETMSALRSMGIRFTASEANFVLCDIGPGHGGFVEAMRARGVLTRDRSADPGCEGRVRITIGTRKQMQRAVQAMKESLDEMGWTAASAERLA